MNKAYTQPGKDNIMEIIKLESDSEDAQTVEKNRNSEIQNQKQEIINLDENVENTKSNSQSSISTSASRGNLPLNKPNIQVKNESNNSSLFTISQRTKRILERINEKNKKAKLLNQFNQNKENENNIDKNVFIGRKTRSKEPNSADKKVKEKKIKLSMKTKEVIKKLKDIRNNRFDNINNDESKKPTIRKSSFIALAYPLKSRIFFNLKILIREALHCPVIFLQGTGNVPGLFIKINAKRILYAGGYRQVILTGFRLFPYTVIPHYGSVIDALEQRKMFTLKPADRVIRRVHMAGNSFCFRFFHDDPTPSWISFYGHFSFEHSIPSHHP